MLDGVPLSRVEGGAPEVETVETLDVNEMSVFLEVDVRLPGTNWLVEPEDPEEEEEAMPDSVPPFEVEEGAPEVETVETLDVNEMSVFLEVDVRLPGTKWLDEPEDKSDVVLGLETMDDEEAMAEDLVDATEEIMDEDWVGWIREGVEPITEFGADEDRLGTIVALVLSDAREPKVLVELLRELGAIELSFDVIAVLDLKSVLPAGRVVTAEETSGSEVPVLETDAVLLPGTIV
ncbi:uncharacterized protein BDR25DRAFT_314754 [Lindgomyces ingoldianus]|uniref:Uncharacterized protein n=1 Tax=Lindgomyces ingoldianus TaxID=673940 RepID=A0ACB6QSI7_9PLEO|nr:uncharacterized protein BDR25DRAFT_314754 [Lindgomyces ingoldianus]KAF2469984.1 hypothetical protein BDR25DRAFT_314754 [Lindgomyces ingoldianus]